MEQELYQRRNTARGANNPAFYSSAGGVLSNGMIPKGDLETGPRSGEPGFQEQPAQDTAKRFSRRPAEDPETSRLRGIVEGSLGEAPIAEDIRATKLKNAQALIDEINAGFNRVIAGEREAGVGREARTRALNVSAGLAGSDFASSAAIETEQKNQQIIDSLERERTTKIASAISNAEDRASEEFRTERDSFISRAEDALSAREAFTTKQRDAATGDMSAIAASGLTAEEFKAQDPDTYAQLLEESGMSEFQAKYYFISKQPKESNLGHTTVGNKQIFFLQDPVSGKIRKEEVDLPEGEKLGPTEDIVTDAYGNPIIVTYAGEVGKSAITGTRSVSGVERKTASSVEADKGFKFSSDDQGKLLAGGFTEQEINTIQSEVKEFGIDKVLANVDESKRDLVRQVLSGEEKKKVFLNEDFFKKAFTPEQLETSAKDAGKTKGGFLGMGKSADTDAYLKYLMTIVDQYRAAGYSDEDILKSMQ